MSTSYRAHIHCYARRVFGGRPCSIAIKVDAALPAGVRERRLLSPRRSVRQFHYLPASFLHRRRTFNGVAEKRLRSREKAAFNNVAVGGSILVNDCIKENVLPIGCIVVMSGVIP